MHRVQKKFSINSAAHHLTAPPLSWFQMAPKAKISRILSFITPAGRWILAVALCYLAMVACPASVSASEETAGAESKSAEAQKKHTSGLADLIPKTAALEERLGDLTRKLAAMPDRGKIDSQLQELEVFLDSLTEKLELLKQEERLRYVRLVEFLRRVESANRNLEDISEPLIARLRKIDEWRDEWRSELADWQQWEAAVEADMALPMVASTFENARQSIHTATCA
jgi:hypothetical protein